MIRDIPPFELGYTTNGAGDPVEDSAVAYSDHAGIERELKLEGEGAIDLMPIIVRALNAYDEMTTALRVAQETLALLTGPVEDVPFKEAFERATAAETQVRAALEKAEGRETSDA